MDKDKIFAGLLMGRPSWVVSRSFRILNDRGAFVRRKGTLTDCGGHILPRTLIDEAAAWPVQSQLLIRALGICRPYASLSESRRTYVAGRMKHISRDGIRGRLNAKRRRQRLIVDLSASGRAGDRGQIAWRLGASVIPDFLIPSCLL